LHGRKLVVLLDEAAPLELVRLDLLGNVPLAFLERDLERAEATRALVELGLAAGEIVLRMELLLVGRYLLTESAAQLLFAGKGGGQLGAERLEIGVGEIEIRSRGDAAGRLGRGDFGIAAPGRRLPATLELGAQTCTEALLGLCDVLRCEFRHAARLPKNGIGSR
jgi:hypothetical protein